MRISVFAAGLILFFSYGCAPQNHINSSSAWEADTYSDTIIRGWPVRINTALNDHPFLLDQAYSTLSSDLSFVETQFPAIVVSQLKSIPIWLELKSRNGQTLQYHRSAGWLRENGFNPRKENSVEIQVREFVKTGRDPSMLYSLFRPVWNDAVAQGYKPEIPEHSSQVNASVTSITPPEFGFYSKRLDCAGIPVKSSDRVADAALSTACARIQMMLMHIPNVRTNLCNANSEFHIIGRSEQTSDLPEFKQMKGKQYQAHPDEPTMEFDERVRGTADVQACSGEENLLHFFTDRQRTKDICVHEFAHVIFNTGFSESAREAVRHQYNSSRSKDLWRGNYARENADEFFAELSMWYFGTHGDQTATYVGVGRESLAKYDSGAYSLIDSLYSGRFPILIQQVDTLDAIPPSKARVSQAGPASTIQFKNHTNFAVSIFWIDYHGDRQSRGQIDPGGILVERTFVSHPFVVTDKNGHDFAEFVARSGQCIAEIREQK